MSLALLKKSLDILDESSAKDADKETETRAKAKGKQKSNRVMEMHSSQNRAIVKIKDIRLEITQGKKKSQENLKRLLALSRNSLKDTDAQKFVKRAHKGRYEDVELPKREIESIFTEEDFRAFEEEYFKSNC